MLLDLDYSEDSAAEVDMNVVLTGDGRFVEIQGTAETEPFDRDLMNRMIDAAASGVDRLVAIQREVIVQTLGGKNSARWLTRIAHKNQLEGRRIVIRSYRFYSLLVLFAALLAPAAFAQSATEVFEDPDGKYTLNLPAGWLGIVNTDGLGRATSTSSTKCARTAR